MMKYFALPDGYYWYEDDGERQVIQISDNTTVYFMNDERTCKVGELEGKVMNRIYEPWSHGLDDAIYEHLVNLLSEWTEAKMHEVGQMG